MSSPRRAAKGVAKPAAKLAAKRRPAADLRPVPKRDAESEASADVKRVAAALERSIVDDTFGALSPEALQKLIAAACRVYTARRQAGEQFAPIPKNSITATDVMITASGLLKSADLAVFELGMWQNWTGR